MRLVRISKLNTERSRGRSLQRSLEREKRDLNQVGIGKRKFWKSKH